MSESEEELDGGTVGEAMQQPAVKQEEEEEEEEFDGGVIDHRGRRRRRGEPDGGVLAEADLYEERTLLRHSHSPTLGAAGKQGASGLRRRAAGEGARVSEGKRFRAEETEARPAAPKAAREPDARRRRGCAS